MKTFSIILGIGCLAAVSLAENATGNSDPQATGGQILSQLSQSAKQELDKSIVELNTLREQIATEKLPLAQELTAQEDKLIQCRQDYDKIMRLMDSGNLELASMKSEMKARQDELSYIGNLLDEYARSFETKINICELQWEFNSCGETLDAAKKATENNTLSMRDKFDRQLAFVKVSADRLYDAIGGMHFLGVGVDVQGTVEDGTFTIIGPVALFRAKTGPTAGLVIPQSGSTKPLIRPLEGQMQVELAALVEKGEGIMPLDPTRGGALKAMVQKTSLVHIFKKGGPIMWPLLLSAVLALCTVLERILFLLIQRINRDSKGMEKFFAALERGNTEEAVQVSKPSRFYVVRSLGYALAHKEKSLANALVYAQEQEMKRFRRGIPVLDTIITLAPLLGLLGTVTGMMGSFSLIGGELSSPGAITGGIAEALIATAFGLGIAITSLIPFNYLNTKMEEARIEIETAAKQLELLIHPQAAVVTGDAETSENIQEN